MTVDSSAAHIFKYSPKSYKTWLCTFSLVLAALIVWSLFSHSSRELELSSELRVKCQLPSLIASINQPEWVIKVTSNNTPLGEITMTGSLQEGPVLFLPGRASNTIDCVYFNDTHVEVIIIELRSNLVAGASSSTLSKIVTSTSWEVRRVTTKDEFGAFAAHLRTLDEKNLKAFSVPANQIGPIHFYLRREQILGQLEKRADPHYYLE